MEDEFLILKLSFLSFLLSANLFAISVLVSKEAINYEEKLDSSKVKLQNVSEINKYCEEETEKCDKGSVYNNNYNIWLR